MKAADRVRLGRSSVEVTRLGLGCAPLGGLFHAVTDDDASDAVRLAWEAGVRLFDTAPLYGSGLSERRVGAALASCDRSALVLSTKVGRLLVPGQPDGLFHGAPRLGPVFDFSREGVLRSIEASLERLKLDRIDVVLVHDPDGHEEQATDEAFPALLSLREQGVVGAVGCGMNQAAMPARFVERLPIDVVLLAGRLTLLDQSGMDALVPRCVEHGVSIVAAGVFNSGVLANPSLGATYDYEPAGPEVLRRAVALQSACAGHGVTLAAAAVQYPLRYGPVASVLVGARDAGEVRAAVAAFEHPVPEALWADLAHLGVRAPC